eukprot:TRINITY_DN2002_c0_g1_i3.p1 TRINITY_DN2002_c0_g1~~TRINITY_DN2002_c0_g1_i3.p1  ORF type:complete len:445 (-),score=109.18 TRINITY_DN2002_c0_g1_i3:103-1437(-)
MTAAAGHLLRLHLLLLSPGVLALQESPARSLSRVLQEDTAFAARRFEVLSSLTAPSRHDAGVPDALAVTLVETAKLNGGHDIALPLLARNESEEKDTDAGSRRHANVSAFVAALKDGIGTGDRAEDAQEKGKDEGSTRLANVSASVAALKEGIGTGNGEEDADEKDTDAGSKRLANVSASVAALKDSIGTGDRAADADEKDTNAGSTRLANVSASVAALKEGIGTGDRAEDAAASSQSQEHISRNEDIPYADRASSIESNIETSGVTPPCQPIGTSSASVDERVTSSVGEESERESLPAQIPVVYIKSADSSGGASSEVEPAGHPQADVEWVTSLSRAVDVETRAGVARDSRAQAEVARLGLTAAQRDLSKLREQKEAVGSEVAEAKDLAEKDRVNIQEATVALTSLREDHEAAAKDANDMLAAGARALHAAVNQSGKVPWLRS